MKSMAERFAEFQRMPSWGKKAVCPKCGTNKTEPCPGCGCPPIYLSDGTMLESRDHIMKYHHRCPEPTKFYDATNDYDALNYLKEVHCEEA